MYNETLRLAQGVDALIAPIADFNTADAVEYLNTLDRDEAAQVLAALPQPRAVKLLEQPELHAASALVALLPAEQAASCSGRWPTTAPPTSSTAWMPTSARHCCGCSVPRRGCRSRR